MNYAALKQQLLALREKIIDDPDVSIRETEDLKAAVLVLIMHINHRVADGK